jgi:hypothetical protein
MKLFHEWVSIFQYSRNIDTLGHKEKTEVGSRLDCVRLSFEMIVLDSKDDIRVYEKL